MGKKKAAAAVTFRCGNLDCNLTGRDKVNKVCAACRAVWYCCRKCQGQHWSSRGGNHRAHCTPPPKPASASPRARSTPAVAADDPEHPCPICMVNEDDHGQYGQCSECGQLYCGECNGPEAMGRITNCPTCRAPVRVPASVQLARLLRLVGRSPGRHTPVAQCNLGVMHSSGNGVPQDHTEAAPWYRLAADQGHPQAQHTLAVMYANGIGVPQDDAEAVRLYQLAADQRNVNAEYNLALMHEHGKGVPQDHTEAARRYRLAADQGFAAAQFNLALQCYHGTGAPQDHAETARLLLLAADQDYEPAQNFLGRLTAQFPVGTRVQVGGLVAAAQLNGSLGTVVQQPTTLAAGRVAVRIDGQTKITSVSWAKITRSGDAV